MIPTGKNVLSDASGASQLIASLNVLGEVITYPELSGCDEDPSSVYDSGANVYFCNKALSKVYRWTRGGGVEDISAKGVSSFIRAALKRAINTGQVRVVGGFDPLKEEYLLSIQNLEEHETSGVELVDQPVGTVAPEEDDGTEPPDSTTLLVSAYNDFYLTNLSSEDMSAELAINYLKDLENDPNQANHPTFDNLADLLNGIDDSLFAKFRFDYHTEGLVSSADLTQFLSVYNTEYNTSGSIFIPQTNPAALPPPPSVKLPLFTSTQEAVDYLIGAGHMKVWEFYQYFSSYQVADMRHVYNVNNSGSITITDFLVFLSVFGQDISGNDSAFKDSYPGPTIENPEFSATQVLGFIQQQHVLGVDPMTVGQFYQLGEHLNDLMRLNSNAIYEYAVLQGGTTQQDGYDATFSITTVDMLNYLSVLPSGGAQPSGTNDWTYDLNDLIFGL